MKYIFINTWQRFKAGDDVPESLGLGIIQSLIRGHKIEEVIETKIIERPPQDKMMRRTKQKAVVLTVNTEAVDGGMMG